MANLRKWLFISLLGMSLTYLLLQLVVHFTSPLPPPAGRHFTVDKHWVHYVCTGTGDQVVFFESGILADAQQSWQPISYELFDKARTCYYDRLGYGWSTPQPEGYTQEQEVELLGQVIDEVSGRKPVILVGHGYGGILARQYADQNGDKVKALLLVDSAHEQQHARLGDAFSPISETQAQLYRLSAVTGFSTIRSWFKNLGNPSSIDTRVSMQRASVEFADTMLNYTRQGALETPLEEMQYDLGDMPMVVMRHDPDVYAEEDMPQASETWQTLQSELLSLSSNARMQMVPGAGHDIHRDKPEAVIAAIESLLGSDQPSHTHSPTKS